MISRDRAVDLLRRANPAPPGARLVDAAATQRLLDELAERSDSMETEELARVMAPLPPRPGRRRWAIAAGIAAVVIAAVGAGVVLGWFESNPEPDVVSPSPTTTVAETQTTVGEVTTTAPTSGTTSNALDSANQALAWPAEPAWNPTLDEQSGLIVVLDEAEETWVFDPAEGTWAVQAPESAPWFRVDASTTYDAGMDRVVVFGGDPSPGVVDAERPTWNDLWYYDVEGDTWEQVPVEGDRPEPRVDAGMVYIASIDQVFLFGGNQDSYDRRPSNQLSDVWLFDAASARWMKVEGEGPPPSIRPTVVYNPDVDEVLVYGKEGAEAGSLWVYDVASVIWSSRPLPDGWVTCYERLWRGFEPRCGLPGIYDQSRRRILSVEGDDLLTLDPVTDAVERIATTGADLPIRDHSLILDEGRDTLLMFRGGDDEVDHQLWRLDLTTLAWSRIGPPDA